MREHGGDLDRAIAQYGGERHEWLDLSTGINPYAYRVSQIADDIWSSLPDSLLYDEAEGAAQMAYETKARCLPLSGAQQAIQLYPAIIPQGARQAHILSPTYNEHEAQLQKHGWQITPCRTLDALRGADCAVIVHPNNPDGHMTSPHDLLALAREVGTLIVDESFCDPHPELSLLPYLGDQESNIIVLRSFGKFYGLAGMRLGFVCGTSALVQHISDAAGKWSVSGPALVLGTKALTDRDWRLAMIDKLAQESSRLDEIICSAGVGLVGGTTLFRLYEADDARAFQERLAKHHIWSRIFGYNPKWIRLGLPDEAGWARLQSALKS